MREGSTRCTPIAPVSGPLTHGVAVTQPSVNATLISVYCAVALCTLSISGVVSPFAQATDIPRGSRIVSAQSARRFGFELFMLLSLLTCRSTDREREPR